MPPLRMPLRQVVEGERLSLEMALGEMVEKMASGSC
jgi:hypothetical protein